MAWSKAPQALVERFHAVLPSDPSVERRQMFGYPCAIVHGHMFAGLHQDRMILRLSDAELHEFTEREGAQPFEPMPNRPMRGFAVVPEKLLDDVEVLSRWVEKAFMSAAAMPAKAPKPRGRTRTRP